MPRLLILNPNTSAQVTDMLRGHLQPMLGEGWQIDTATARFGGAYIASEAAYAIAAHAVLDAWSTQAPGHDAILVGCFGDPGLEALRELAGCPVIGLAEAAMQEAARAGRFVIVTGGERWEPILRRLAASAGLLDRMCGLKVLKESGSELLADPEAALLKLEAAAREAVAETGADAVIIGGAALAGMGEALAARLPFAVIDNVSAAARAVLALAPAQGAGPDGTRYSGLSPELTARLG